MDGEVLELETELPQGERRERLLLALGRLIARNGAEPFLCAPILLPTREYFPEPAERTLQGAGVLTLRLLRYARLAPTPVVLTGYRERPRRVGEQLAIHHQGDRAAAWYAGVKDGAVQFGLALRGLRDDDSLVAALSHEVTHAYRDRHGLVVQDRDAEEKLTDLTGVYLGFGVFLSNASHRVTTGGRGEEGERLLYERASLGYLSPAEFALLLAAQVVARGLEQRARRSIRDALGSNHARLFDLGVAELEPDAASLRHQLGVPEPDAQPEPWSSAAGELDLGELRTIEPSAPVEVAKASGVVAFRVPQNHPGLFGVVGALGSLLVGSALGVEGAPWLGVFGIGIALGVLWGGKSQHESCSGCRRRVRPDDRECRGCGARLVGEIKSFDQRLAAEEEFLAAERRARSDQAEPRPRTRRDATSDCLSALLMAWVLKNGLTRAKPSSALSELIERVQAGDLDVEALRGAWDWDPQPFSQEGYHFCSYYMENRKLRDHDYRILTTASHLRPDLGTFKRFSAILDRRLSEWRERGDGPPRHAL